MIRRLGPLSAIALIACTAILGLAGSATAAPSIRHVFVIVLENENFATSFGPNSPAPYLSKTLVAQGGYIPNYYGIGHSSLDNYIAMVSGQAPNSTTRADCPTFSDFTTSGTDANGQQLGTGCVYPSAIPTVAGQLSAAGLSWRGYSEDMGNNPTREAATCGHPALNTPDMTESATATDQYATRHNPFVYFHSIIDNASLCNANVVNLSKLPADLSNAAATPNYVFITPNLCNDGHDAPCQNGDPGGLVQADKFLQTWVPQITGSSAFRQDGLLLVIFDEATSADSSACCGEIPGPGAAQPGGNGPGGGQVGAVALSPCIAPGTVTQTAYNHYSMLRSVEDTFGLSHLAYANLAGETSFGSDLFNRPCGPATPRASITAPPLLSAVSTTAKVPVSWSADTSGGTPLATYSVQVRDLSVPGSPSRTLANLTQATSLTFPGTLGHAYEFQVQATNMAGQASPFATATTVIPSGARPAKGHYGRGWKRGRVHGAWNGHAITTKRKGASFKFTFGGTKLVIIGETGKHGGTARVTIDGKRHTVHFHAAKRHVDHVVFSTSLRAKKHHLKLQVLHGTVSLEGYAVTPG
jgi:hypothetical protein